MKLFSGSKAKQAKQLKKEEEKLALQILLNFAVGRISTEDFWKEYKKNEVIRNILIEDKTRQKGYVTFDVTTKEFIKNNKIPFDIKSPFSPENLLRTIKIERLYHRYELYLDVRGYFYRRKENINYYNKDEIEYQKVRAILPKWIDVADADFLNSIIASAPSTLTKTQQKEWCKNKIKERFKYDNTPPNWVQESEWPIINDNPFTFSHQETTTEGFERYWFYNPDDNMDKVIIEQCE